MISLTKKQLHDIAGELTISMEVYIHKQTGEIRSIPNEELLEFMAHEDPDDHYEEIMRFKATADETDSHYVIREMDSSYAFNIMQEFAENLEGDDELREELLEILENRKPFRNFKNKVDNSGEYRERWFAYLDKRSMDYVAESLESQILAEKDWEDLPDD